MELYHRPLHVQKICLTLFFTFSNIWSLFVAKACLERLAYLYLEVLGLWGSHHHAWISLCLSV